MVLSMTTTSRLRHSTSRICRRRGWPSGHSGFALLPSSRLPGPRATGLAAVAALIGSPYERSFTFVGLAVLLLVSWPDRPAFAVPVNWRLGRLGDTPAARSS